MPQSQNQEKLGQRSIRKQTRQSYKGLITVDGVEMSYCSNCKEWHPVSDFNKDNTRACGYQCVCREAQAFLRKQYRDYPIPSGTVCAFNNCTDLACERDHDHETGEFRAFLCSKHNSMLGRADDNIEELQAGIDYLTTYETIN